jgi:hypothetical protein
VDAAAVTASLIHPDKYRHARDAVLARCQSLYLCESARLRCIGKAFDELASGRSVAVAVVEGNKLAKRIAECRVFVADGGLA